MKVENLEKSLALLVTGPFLYFITHTRKENARRFPYCNNCYRGKHHFVDLSPWTG